VQTYSANLGWFSQRSEWYRLFGKLGHILSSRTHGCLCT